jgi:type IV secretion system protein VirB1
MLIGSLLLITSLCAQCGPSVEPSTTRAIIQVESGGNPYAIGDNTLKKSFFPKSKKEAVELAEYLLSQDHNLDMGLMQINSQHLKAGKFPLDDIFDPCRNIAIGTGILSDFYRRNDRGEARNVVLFKALSAYNTGSAWRGPGYINRILKAARAPYRVAVTNPPPARMKNTVSASGARDLRRKSSGRDFQTPDSATLFFPSTGRGGEAHGL